MKNNKGITLIALVVTIIVLLILAAVSIAMLTGENGILKRAADARDNSANGTLEEATKIAIGNIMTNDLRWKYSSEATASAENNATALKNRLVGENNDAGELKEVNSNISVQTATISNDNKEITIVANVDSSGNNNTKQQTVKVTVSSGAVTIVK